MGQVIANSDVKYYGLLGSQIEDRKLSNIIDSTEFAVARNILGYDFWQVLTADVDEDDREAESYDENSEYNTGEYVNYYGVTWKSNQDNNADLPGEDSWTASSRFGTAGYETLWTGYLRPYLAALLSCRMFPYLQPVGAAGMVEHVENGDGSKSADMAAQSYRLREMKRTTSQMLSNLFWYVIYQKKKQDSKLFDKSLIVRCPTKIRQSISAKTRRFYLRPDTNDPTLDELHQIDELD